MRNITAIFFLFIVSYGYTQDHPVLKGKITVDSLPIEDAHVLNQTQNLGVISTKEGAFEIKAKVGDTLVFSSIQYALKQYIVVQEDLEASDFEIELEQAVNTLDEVKISQYSLSGSLRDDVLNIPTHTENLPFWNASELKQMGVKGFDDSQSLVKNKVLQDEMEATPMNLLPAIKVIGQIFKKKRKKYVPAIKVTDLYSKSFFIEGLKIPEEEYYNFIDFLNEQPGIVAALQSPDKLKTLEYVIAKSQVFRSTYMSDK